MVRALCCGARHNLLSGNLVSSGLLRIIRLGLSAFCALPLLLLKITKDCSRGEMSFGWYEVFLALDFRLKKAFKKLAGFYALMVELVDAPVLETGDREVVWVRVPLGAPIMYGCNRGLIPRPTL